MVKPRKLHPLPLLDEQSMRAFLEERGIKDIHRRQVGKLIIKFRPQTTHELAELTKTETRKLLPTGLVQDLAEHFVVTTSKVVERHESVDGTIKLLVELQDGQRVEAVIIRHDGRNTLCVSSQIGCQMGCTFCATGTMGIKGNLWGGEILEQLYHANGEVPIRNVVFMVRCPLNSPPTPTHPFDPCASIFIHSRHSSLLPRAGHGRTVAKSHASHGRSAGHA